MIHIQTGDLVRVKKDLQYGLGVRKEQLEYAGKEFTVEHEEGFGLYLKGNDFYWMPTSLELIQKGAY